MLKLLNRSVIYQIRCLSTQPVFAAGTLSPRLHQYLRRNEKNRENTQKLSLFLFNLQKCSPEEIQKKLFNELKSANSNSSEIFQLLDSLFQVNVNIQLQKLNFFSEALKIITGNLTHSFDKNDFIKLCFYTTFYKKNHPGPTLVKNIFEKFLMRSLESELTSLDVAILCLASYKCSVRISNEKFNQKVIDEFIATSEDDEYLLVAFLKSLRFNRVKSDKLLDKLKNLDFAKHNYQSLVHIVPYLADNKINDTELNEKIVKRCIDTFNSEVRVKDIQNMLHSCALLNLKIDDDHLKKIENMIVNATKSVEFINFFDQYVNSALSLWILDYRCVKLAKILLADQRFYESGPYSRIKLDSRKKLLSTCIEIEQPELIENLKYKSFEESRLSPGFLIRPSLEKAMTQNLSRHKTAKFVHQIKNLNIAGIMVSNSDGSRTHYEVLDQMTSLADNLTPNGLFELKLRLLRKRSCKVKVINVLSQHVS